MTRLPLYPRVLGEAWHTLPEAIRRMHDNDAETRATGLAEVERGTGLAARIIATTVGFPPAGRAIPVEVRFSPDAEGGELWLRAFAGKPFASYQRPHSGAITAVEERFGPIVMVLSLTASSDRLEIAPVGWRFWVIPLPRALMPIGETYEIVDAEGRFNFHVEIGHPWLGLIVRYRGYLVPVA